MEEKELNLEELANGTGGLRIPNGGKCGRSAQQRCALPVALEPHILILSAENGTATNAGIFSQIELI